MQFPSIFVTAKTKYHFLVVLLLFLLSMYLFTNHIQFFESSRLPMTWVDLYIPFLPHTIWIYLSYYINLLIAYMWEKDIKFLNRIIGSATFVMCVSFIIFILDPTVYERQFQTELRAMDPFTATLYETLHVVDSPHNCFPSLHVSLSFLTSFVWFKRFPKRFWGFFIWAIMIAISTLTTKQHYFWDVISGFWLAVVGYWLFFSKKRPKFAKH